MQRGRRPGFSGCQALAPEGKSSDYEATLAAQSSEREAWNRATELQNQIDRLQDEVANLKTRLVAVPPPIADHVRWVNAGACRDLISAIFANQKIAAIKAVRTMCGLGLREAKDLVEEFPNFRPGQY